MGEQGSSGYAITVDDVRIARGAAQMSVTEESPASRCIVLAVITDPVAVVVGPRSQARRRSWSAMRGTSVASFGHELNIAGDLFGVLHAIGA